MLMALGFFIFELRTVPVQKRSTTVEQRWAASEPVNAHPTYQHLGPGQQTKTLSGTLYPELTGGALTLDVLHEMANAGEAYTLLESNGDFKGTWIITRIQSNERDFNHIYQARAIEFTVELKRYNQRTSIEQQLQSTLDGIGNAVSNRLG